MTKIFLLMSVLRESDLCFSILKLLPFLALFRVGLINIYFGFQLFHDGDRYHRETSLLICYPNQRTGFSKSVDCFLYDNGLLHERVNKPVGLKNLLIRKRDGY